MYSRLKKVAAASVASAFIMFGVSTAASAHVTPVEPAAPADGYATVELQVPHGCDGAATERVEVQLDERISSVTAEAIPGWSVSYEREALTEPIELHGQEVTEYVSVVTWTAQGDPLPDDEYLRFGISMKTPNAPGETMLLPTVQSCVGGGTSSWIEQDPDGEHPAPAVELTAAQGGHGDEDADTAGVDDAPEGSSTDGVAAAPTDSSSGSDSLSLVLAIVAIVIAAVAVVLSLRKRTA